MAANSLDPFDQFKIKKIVNLEIGFIDISFTNSSLYMVLATIIAVLFMIITTRTTSLVPNRWQMVGELLYNFINSMIDTNIGKNGRKFFPIVFSTFLLILLCNILGMTPYSFTPTSHIAVTFALAIITFSTVVIYAFIKKGFVGFFKMFLPSGVPVVIAPLIFIMEFFSFFIRPVTLSVRLFANMVAGHVLLKVVAIFAVSLGVALSFLPVLFLIPLIGFELFVAAIQAYIFTILVCVYLGEVNNSH